MGRSICHVATAEDSGKRLDTVLAERGIYASRSAAGNAISKGKVLVNGNSVQKSHQVSTGQAIVCELEESGSGIAMTGEPIDLDIRYEDDDLIVLSKQSGLLTHPSPEHTSGTLVNALIYHCGIDNLCNVQGEDDRPGIVHRLDAETSGLMLAAKTDTAGLALMEAIRLRQVDRRYITLVHGIIAPDSAMIDAPIARHQTDRTKMAVADTASARDAITTFKVLQRFEGGSHDNGYTLVECKLFTGRTHQIRVHMQYAKHPVVGDPLYTAHTPHDSRAQLGLNRQFLHSYSIGFEHPITGEELSFKDKLPEDLAETLKAVQERSYTVTEYGNEIRNILE